MNLFYQPPVGTVNGEKQPKSMAKINSKTLCMSGFDHDGETLPKRWKWKMQGRNDKNAKMFSYGEQMGFISPREGENDSRTAKMKLKIVHVIGTGVLLRWFDW